MDTKTLDAFFVETKYGLELTDPYSQPTLKHFEAKGQELATQLDKVQFKLGDWAVLLARIHGYTAYEAVAVKVGLSPQTVETQWAYTCRNVPAQARNSLSISHHREVAQVKDTMEQRDLLNYALQNNLNVQQLREHVARFMGKPVPPPPVSGTGATFERDLAFELTEQIHNLEQRVTREQQRADRAEKNLMTLRTRIEGLLSMPTTDFVANIQEVIKVLKEVLQTLSKN